MEETMTRIAEALERVEAIQTNNDKQVKQYQQLRADLAKDIQKALSEKQPVRNQLDAEKLAAHLLPSLTGKLPDPSAIRAAGQEILEGIRAESQKIPAEVRMKGDFYGMASQKAFIAYLMVLVIVILGAGGTALYYWEEAQDKTIRKVADQLYVQQGYYENQIEAYKRDNPKYGEKYFPAFDKTKLQTLVDQLNREAINPKE